MGCVSDNYARWKQTFRNIENIKNSYRIGALFEKFNNFPIIVLGAGPSMQEFIDAYKKYPELSRCLIIACDASLQRLLKEGIRPHIVTRCERKRTTIFGDLTKKDTRGVIYAGYSWTPPEFFDLFDEKFMVFRDNGINNWTGFKPGSVNGGVSSANAALELAFLLGKNNQIYTSGIDLVMKDGKSHVGGAMVEFDLTKSKKLWREIECNDGQKRTTVPVWERCLREYNGGITKHKFRKCEVINTATSGAILLHTTHLAWDEAIKTMRFSRHNVKRVLNGLKEKHGPLFTKRFEIKKNKTKQMLNELKKDLDHIKDFLKDQMRIIREEEFRMVNQMRWLADPGEFFKNYEGVKQVLAKAYHEPIRQIENFHKKWFVKKEFLFTILDSCQIDFFISQNRVAGLRNLVDLEHERGKYFISINAILFGAMETCANRLLWIFENGAPVEEYVPEKEHMDADGYFPKSEIIDSLNKVTDQKISLKSGNSGFIKIPKDATLIGRSPIPESVLRRGRARG